MLIEGRAQMPLICGHEFSGHIVALGENVDGFEIGELVVALRSFPAVAANSVSAANFPAAATTIISAVGATAPMPNSSSRRPQSAEDAERRRPDRRRHGRPGLDRDSCAVEGGRGQIGARGGVVGCGPIGLFAIQWMRLMGAREVVAVDVSEPKLALARAAGATPRPARLETRRPRACRATW